MFAAALVYILAVISPGPNFLLVSRFSSSSSVSAGLGASLGIVMVGLMFSTASVTGLALLIHEFPSFSKLAAIMGAIYLLYISFVILSDVFKRSGLTKKENSEKKSTVDFWRAWRTGVITNIFNMKTIAFMISIFAGFLAVDRTWMEKITVIVICSTLEFSWYSSVSLVFGRGSVKKFYIENNKTIDVVMAIFLIIFSAKTAMEAY